MPKDWAYENAEALSFVTAPPNNAELAHTRFKGSRNMPYKGAELSSPLNSPIDFWFL